MEGDELTAWPFDSCTIFTPTDAPMRVAPASIILRASAAEPTPQILLDEAVLLSDAIRADTRAVAIKLRHERARREHLAKLAEHLQKCRGGCPVTLTLLLDGGVEVQLALGAEFRVEPSDAMLAGLERLFGEKVAELRTS